MPQKCQEDIYTEVDRYIQRICNQLHLPTKKDLKTQSHATDLTDLSK